MKKKFFAYMIIGILLGFQYNTRQNWTLTSLILDEREYEDKVKKNAFFCRKRHPELSHTLKNY